MGLLIPGTSAKVVNTTTGECVGPDQPGEVCIKGPQVFFQNYHLGIVGLQHKDKRYES
jgi:acyl-CoA synthetase (AMP-forming)/AMP-acid ligase II